MEAKIKKNKKEVTVENLPSSPTVQQKYPPRT